MVKTKGFVQVGFDRWGGSEKRSWELGVISSPRRYDLYKGELGGKLELGSGEGILQN